MTQTLSHSSTPNPFGGNLQASRPRRSPQLLQLTAIADATGSSAPFARGVTAILGALARELPQRLASVSFSLVASRDADIGESDETLLRDGDAQAMLAALPTLRFEGGGDADETHFWSVRDALADTLWQDGPMRRRAIVLLGSSHSKAIPGMTLEQLALELGNRRITVFVVAPPDTNLKVLAELTDGLFFDLSNDPSPDEVRRLTQRLTSSMTATLTGAAVASAAASHPQAVAL